MAMRWEIDILLKEAHELPLRRDHAFTQDDALDAAVVIFLQEVCGYSAEDVCRYDDDQVSVRGFIASGVDTRRDQGSAEARHAAVVEAVEKVAPGAEITTRWQEVPEERWDHEFSSSGQGSVAAEALPKGTRQTR